MPLRVWLGTLVAAYSLVSCDGGDGSGDEATPGSTAASEQHVGESRIEREIRTSLKKTAKVSVEADCLEPERWRAGATFPCALTFNPHETVQRIRVTMKANGTYDWRVTLVG